MTLAQALLYFLREAVVNLARSWKVSLLAVLTIAVSLFVGGAFLLAGSNLAEVAQEWRREARVVLYLKAGAAEAERLALLEEARSLPWAAEVVEVGPREARQRFQEAFPSLADLVEGEEAAALPASIEVVLAPAAQPQAVSAWTEEMRAAPAVDMVDDDRDWLRQLEALIAVLRGSGLVVGAVLLGAAIFTIASIIRLTAFLYHEEISVMRLVGATEFFIRGPFYVEGVLQGLLGGGLALAALFGAYQGLAPEDGLGVVGRVLAPGFFAWNEALGLVLVGGLAGLAGSLLSLRSEKLDEVANVGNAEA